jgi:hypothetical protein
MAMATMAGPAGAVSTPARSAMSPAAAAGAAAANPPSGHWGPARVIPLAGLGAAGGGRIEAMSCASPGNCTAGGTYLDHGGNRQVFVVSEVHGAWGKPGGIPGLTGTSHGGAIAEVSSLSCPTAGDCAAAGSFGDTHEEDHPFIAESNHGTWGRPVRLDFGDTDIELGNAFEARSVSCPTPGNCTAGLIVSVADPPPSTGAGAQAFTVDEVNGAWHTAQPVPDTPLLNDGLDAGIISVSCSSPGNCLAGGWYTHNARHALVATETDGVWGPGTELPGIRDLPDFSSDADAFISSVSCLPAGGCTVTGKYDGAADHGFVSAESDGTWTALAITPGPLPATNPVTTVNGVSCGAGMAGGAGGAGTTSGGCAVVGRMVDISGSRAFVWSDFAAASDDAQLISGLAGKPGAEADAVACAADRCVTGGIFDDTSDHMRVFVADESAGAWGAAHQIGGIPKTDASAGVNVASCAGPGSCAIGGSFADAAGADHAFVADESPATATRLTLSAANITFGRERAEHITVTVTPRTGGSPSGRVAVKAGSATVCTVTLARGKGTCTLAAARLRPGKYQLSARYGGDLVYAASTAPGKTLTVTR